MKENHICNTNYDTPETKSDIKLTSADPFNTYYKCNVCNKEFYKRNGTDMIRPRIPENTDIAFIREIAKKISIDNNSIEILSITDYILNDPRFSVWSGSSQPHQHHYGDGGLAKHTRETIILCLRNLYFLVQSNMFPMPLVCKDDKEYRDEFMRQTEMELYFAALFHDAGKMYDYKKIEFTENTVDSYMNHNWESAPHKRLIHHISRSAIIWTEATINCPIIKEKYYENVLHAILSHHMSREAGSPVAPKSRIAWILTLCDNMSARMNDADTLDIIKHNK